MNTASLTIICARCGKQVDELSQTYDPRQPGGFLNEAICHGSREIIPLHLARMSARRGELVRIRCFQSEEFLPGLCQFVA